MDLSRAETVFPSQFATTFDVELTPLPCLQHLTADERQAHRRRAVGEIQATDDSTEMEFRIRYRAFVDAFLAAALLLQERARELKDMFPWGPSRRPCLSTPRPDRDWPPRR